jgi:class 3 adenylate cyclase
VGTPPVQYARNGDVSIAYQVVGDGPRDLIFIPGFVSNLEVIWEWPKARQFFERLASFSRLIAWDKREQGLSDRTGQPPTLEQGMEDMRAVLDAAGSEQAALFGVSEGGPMACLFAASFPARVSHLVLYGTWARLIRAEDHPAGVPREGFDRWLERTAADWGGPAALATFAPSAVEDDEAAVWWARMLRSGTSPRAAKSLMAMYRDIDVRPALATVASPTLVVHRLGDRLSPAGQARVLADLIPNAREVELEGEDHAFFLGDVEPLLDEVEEFVTGTRHEREPDRVLATVLFTDIVGSTERAAAAGDRDWRALLERHDELVRRQLERFRGREVKQTGDGFLATFDGPARAVSCASAITEQVRGLGLEVRAGVHTGECEQRNGDLAGMAVHIGARVGASAGPGEVLVSSTVKDLVVGSGLEFEDRGATELKGVPGEWRLYALAGARQAA